MPASVVQKRTSTVFSSGTTGSLAFSSNNTSGNSIVVCVRAGNIPGTGTTVTDTHSQTYTSVIERNGNNAYGSIFRTDGIASGANTVSILFTGTATTYYIDIFEMSPLLATDQSAFSEGASGTPNVALTTLFPGEFVVMAAGTGQDPGTVSAASGFILDSSATPGTAGGGTCHQIQASAGVTNPTLNCTNSIFWDAVAATFRSAASVGAVITGVGTVTAALTGKGALASVISGTAVVTASISGFATVASAITGQTVVTAVLTGAGSLTSIISGHAVVTTSLMGAGALASVIAGQASVSLQGASGSLTSNILGSSAVLATAFSSSLSSILGTSSVFATLGGAGPLNAAIIGTSFVFAAPSNIGPSSNILGVGSVVGFLSKTKTFFPPNNPMGRQFPTYILRDFGSTYTVPSFLSVTDNSKHLFYQNSFLPSAANPARTAGNVQPPKWSTPGTPDGFNYQGRVQAPGVLMLPPGTGSLNGKVYKVFADGMIFIPQSASNATFNLIMSQNYFGFGVAPIADTLFTLTLPIAVQSGSMVGWSLVATLAGNGVGNPNLASAGILWVGGVQYTGSGYSINPPQEVSGHLHLIHRKEPIIQLSFGVQFGGSPGVDPFLAFLSTFEIKEDRI